MTNFEKLKSMSFDDIVNFLNEHGMYDNSPWMDWWNETYCERCESIIVPAEEAKEKLGLTPFYTEDYKCAYCELHDHCKFFPNREDPDVKDIITMWLNAEEDNSNEAN